MDFVAKRNWNDLAEQLIGDQQHIFPGDERIEFALAALPFPELVGQFPEPQGPRRRRQNIQENLETASFVPESFIEPCPSAL